MYLHLYSSGTFKFALDSMSVRCRVFFECFLSSFEIKECMKLSSNGVGTSVSVSTTPKMASRSIVTSYGAQLSMTMEQILSLLIETNCGIPEIVLCCGAAMVATKFASGNGVPAKRVLMIFDDNAGTTICFVAWIV